MPFIIFRESPKLFRTPKANYPSSTYRILPISATKSITNSKLVFAKSREEYISNLREVLSQLESKESQKESSPQGEEEGSSSQASTDYAQSNEDDYFGILSKDNQN